MKNLKKNGSKRILAGLLVLCMCGLAATPLLTASEDCDKALSKCMLDAIISAILTGLQNFPVYSAFCVIGYSWCLQFYMS